MGTNGYIGLAGLLVSSAGFTVSIWLICQSKSAAKRAAHAATEAREAIKAAVAVADFSSAIAIVDEAKRLHRIRSLKALATLPDRYASLRRLLTGIPIAKRDLPTAHRSLIQSAIHQARILEQMVEEALVSSEKRRELSGPRANEILSGVSDNLHAIVTQLQYNR